jgi:predicted RNA-binding Zn-ribbon protein involved in translation (DUF1610 family)
MRLLELDPRWCTASSVESTDQKQGVTFLCPHCRARRLGVFFDLPICGSPPVDLAAFHHDRLRADEHPFDDIHIGQVLWHRVSGETFDTLTLTPSIDASAFGCWHGFITNGEIQ